MRRLFTILLFILFILTDRGNVTVNDPHIPNDYISSEEHWQTQVFQDYTDFCIFKYDSAGSFESITDYSIAAEDDIEKLAGYFSNVQEWMEIENRLDEYSFDESCISAGDYYYIRTKEGQSIGSGTSTYGQYDNYSVYLFDSETLTLYYIRNKS